MRIGKLIAIGGIAATVAVAASAEVVLPEPEQGIHGANSFWFGEECRSEDPGRRARCDGIIQGIASLVRARRFPYCQATYDAARLREAVLPQLNPHSRGQAALAVEAALDRAFPCSVPETPRAPPAPPSAR